MASCSLHAYPFLTWTSGGNFRSASLPLLWLFFASGSQLEYFFHLFRFFGKSACGTRGLVGSEVGREKTLLYLDKHERVRFDGFEELTEYVVDKRYEIFVRLVLGE